MVDRLPLIESTANIPARVTRLPGVSPGAAAAPDQALAGLGADIAQAGGQATQFIVRERAEQRRQEEQAAAERERARQKRVQGYTTESVASLTEKWTRDAAESRANAPSGAANYADQFGEAMQADVDRFVEGIDEDDVEGRAAVRERLTNLRTRFMGPAINYEAAEQLRHRTEQTGRALNSLGNLAVSDPDQYRDYIAEGMQVIADSDLTAEGKDRAREGFRQSVAGAVLDAEAGDDPNALLARLAEGEFDDLVTPEMKTRARNAAEAEQKRRAREAEAAAKAQAAQVEVQNEQNAMMAKLNTGFGLDSQKEADAAFTGFLEQMSGGDPDVAAEMVTPENVTRFAAMSGYVPSVIDRRLASAERVQNPTLLAQAAQMQAALDVGASGVPTKSGDRVEMTLQLARLADMNIQDAASQVIENLPDPKMREVRRDEFNALKLDPIKEAQATALAGGTGFFGALGFGERDIPPELAVEFEDRMRLLYELNGDVDTARDTAAGLLQREWGPSSISGQEELTRHPPERFAPPAAANLSGEQFAGILRQDIADQLGAVGVPTADAAYTLRADSGTQNALAQGEAPSWLVMVENQFGAMVPLRIEETGDLVRYQLPTNEEFQQLAGFEEAVSPVEAELANARRQRGEQPLEGLSITERAEAMGAPVLEGLGIR